MFIKKIINKFVFVYKISNLGYGFKSKIILLFQILRIQINFYFNLSNKPFKCLIQNNNNCAIINFLGTMDEMHALHEIFIERCYSPSITKNIKNILDLGANTGISSIWFSLEFPGCNIHAYEPNPAIYKLLEKNLLPIQNTRTFNKAITYEKGSIEFYVSERSFSSSIYHLGDSKKILIESITLDEAVSSIGSQVDLLKIDIEGAEFDVIKYTSSLNKIKLIVGELHPEKADREINTIINDLNKTHEITHSPLNTKSIIKAIRIN